MEVGVVAKNDEAKVAAVARAHRVEIVNPVHRLALEHTEKVHRELLRDEEMEALNALTERIQRRFGVSFLVGAPQSVSRHSGLRSTIDVRPPQTDMTGRNYHIPTVEKYHTDLGCCRMQQKRLHKSHERSPRLGEPLDNTMGAARETIDTALASNATGEEVSNLDRSATVVLLNADGTLVNIESSNVSRKVYTPRDLADISSSDSLDDLSHESSCTTSDDEAACNHLHGASDVKEALRLPQLPCVSSSPHSRRPIPSRTLLKGLAGCKSNAEGHVPAPPTKTKPNASLPTVRALVAGLEREQVVASHVKSSSRDFQTLSAVTKFAAVEKEIRHQKLVEEKFSRIQCKQEVAESEEEARVRAYYKHVRAAELEATKRDADAREIAVLGRRKQQESLRAALAFIAGEERRGRDDIENEFMLDDPHKRQWLVEALAEGRIAEEAALHTGEAARLQEEAARIKQEAERVIEAKRRAEFTREQQHMKNSCTHSRSGTSVFVGTTSRNVCLVCKVKYDPKKKLYVRLR